MKIFWILLLSLGLSNLALAFDHEGPIYQGIDGEALVSGILAHPGTSAVELGSAILFWPEPNRNFQFGPRIGLLFGNSDFGNRFDLNVGLETNLWLVNVAGPGIALDYVPLSFLGGTSTDAHYRVEAYLNLRFLHFKNTGAWALRLGTLWDTRYQWGAHLGLTLQLGGILNIGDE